VSVFVGVTVIVGGGRGSGQWGDLLWLLRCMRHPADVFGSIFSRLLLWLWPS